MNEYERKYTEPFIGIYTDSEIELNKKLYEECTKSPIDFSVVEALLKEGADPLGPIEREGWELLTHIYYELIDELQEDRSEDLLELTKLFLKYGLDLSKPRIEYDEMGSSNPMWLLGLMLNEKAMPLLEVLLDNGMDADSFGECWGHITFDLINVGCGDPNKDEFWRDACIWAMKATLFGAAYDHIVNNDTDLQEFIDVAHNRYNLHNFKNYDDFEYKFNTSLCSRHPEFYRAIVSIYEKRSDKKVWEVGICLKEEEFVPNV